jgi:hypothetical protein
VPWANEQIAPENRSFPLTKNDGFIVKAETLHRARTDEPTTLLTLVSKAT